jgi:hypothetical protein
MQINTNATKCSYSLLPFIVILIPENLAYFEIFKSKIYLKLSLYKQLKYTKQLKINILNNKIITVFVNIIIL